MNAMAGFGPKKSRREPVEVAEPKPEDRSLDSLLGVRKQRLDRMERERREARTEWQAARAELRRLKLAWRAAVEQCRQYWAQARKDFMSMNTTSGQYQRCKTAYERMRGTAADDHIRCLESLQQCRDRRRHFFDARTRARDASRQQEKLTIVRDELRSLQQQEGT